MPFVADSGPAVNEKAGTCGLLAVFDIPPGAERLFDTSASNAYAWTASRYWMQFVNPLVLVPAVSAAVNGSGRTWCFKGGTLVLNNARLSEGQTVSPTLDGHTFTIHRNDDKSAFKYYTVTLAPNL